MRLQRVRVGVVWTFLLSSTFSLLFLHLFGRRSDIDSNIVSKDRQTQNNKIKKKKKKKKQKKNHKKLCLLIIINLMLI